MRARVANVLTVARKASPARRIALPVRCYAGALAPTMNGRGPAARPGADAVSDRRGDVGQPAVPGRTQARAIRLWESE